MGVPSSRSCSAWWRVWTQQKVALEAETLLSVLLVLLVLLVREAALAMPMTGACLLATAVRS